MVKALQHYASFTFENNRVNFHRNEIFPIGLMLIKTGQESAILSEI